MSETKETQWLVSRLRDGFNDWKPWVWFDSRAEARAFVKAKEAKSADWYYWIDAIKRGPRA